MRSRGRGCSASAVSAWARRSASAEGGSVIARGHSRREMATLLVVSESTVRAHVEHIYAKAGVSSRAAAALFAVEHDLLT